MLTPAQAITAIVPVVTFLLFVAVGLDLTTADFAHVRRRSAVVLAGLLAPVVVLPPLALVLAWLFATDTQTTIAVLLVAASPIGGISNMYSYLARAAPALSVTLTALSCVLAPLTIPMISHALEVTTRLQFNFAAPIAALLGQITLVVCLPVVIGMWIRRRSPDIRARHGRLLQRAAFLGVAVVLMLVILDDLAAFAEAWSATALLAALFVSSSFVVGLITAMFVTRDIRERFTLASEFGARNSGIATAIAVGVLERIDLARFAAIYFMLEVPLLLCAVAVFRRFMTSRGATLATAPVRGMLH